MAWYGTPPLRLRGTSRRSHDCSSHWFNTWTLTALAVCGHRLWTSCWTARAISSCLEFGGGAPASRLTFRAAAPIRSSVLSDFHLSLEDILREDDRQVSDDED